MSHQNTNVQINKNQNKWRFLNYSVINSSLVMLKMSGISRGVIRADIRPIRRPRVGMRIICREHVRACSENFVNC